MILLPNYKILKYLSFNKDIKRNYVFDYLYRIWNSVDTKRIAEVGAEKACAEWLISNGASLKWIGDNEFQNDYDSLSKISADSLKISQIYADNSSINARGLEYLKNITCLDSVTLNNCSQVNDYFLEKLCKMLENQLKVFKITNCVQVTGKGIEEAAKLKKLELLEFYNLPSLENEEAVKKYLETHLIKSCKIITSPS